MFAHLPHRLGWPLLVLVACLTVACVPDRATSSWSETAEVTGALGLAEYPPAKWIPTNNYYNAARKVGQVTIVVVHTTQGGFSGAISWIQNPKSKVSAHYVVSKSGEVVQMVKEEDIAWHVGSENSYTIGIEHEGFVSDPAWVTPQLLDASAKLTCYLVKKWKLQPTKANIKGHVELPNQTHTDPGKYWPWDKYIPMVAACVNGTPLTCPGGCDDGNPCTADACAAGKCTHSPATGACSDGNACTSGDACSASKCVPGKLKNCDDGNPCSADTCNTNTGACSHAATAGGCSDGNACTSGDQCAAGKCSPGKPKACDDGDVCSNDSCDTKTGACVFAPNTGKACSDGDPCTAKDACVAGKCTAGAPTACDDGDPCTLDGCTGGMCKSTPQVGPCSDGDPCTVADNCLTGKCIGAPIQCQDANPCTSDACLGGACVHQPIGGGCDDGDGCTTGDYCAQGLCLAGAPASCDDGLPCTADACHKGQCIHEGGKEPQAVCVDNAVHIIDACGVQGPVHQICPPERPCAQGVCTPLKDASDSGPGHGDGAAGDGAPHGADGLADAPLPADATSPIGAGNSSPTSGCAAGAAGRAGWAWWAVLALAVALLRRVRSGSARGKTVR